MIFIIFFLYIKVTNKHFQKHEEKHLKEAGERKYKKNWERYQNLSEENKGKKQQYYRKRKRIFLQNKSKSKLNK